NNRLTVVPGTESGRPASSTAMRATLRLSSPAWLAAPQKTSSMMAGSMSGCRSSSARNALVARSSGRMWAREPPTFPMGVRQPSMRNPVLFMRSPRESVDAGELPADEQFLDLARSLVEGHDPCVPQVLGDRIVIDVAVAAVDLHRQVG